MLEIQPLTPVILGIIWSAREPEHANRFQLQQLNGAQSHLYVNVSPHNMFVLPAKYKICSTGITVRFVRPSYTFTENGIEGSIGVIRTGVPSSPFTVRVFGGMTSNEKNVYI